MNFNILPYNLLNTLIIQQNQRSSSFAMSRNISCTLRINLSCIQGKMSLKIIRFLFSVSSNQARLGSTKLNNAKTLSAHIVTHIMRGISLTGSQSHIILTYSMAPLLNGFPVNRPKLCGSVPMLRQDKCIQV